MIAQQDRREGFSSRRSCCCPPWCSTGQRGSAKCRFLPPFLPTEINFCSLTQSESLPPLGGRWRIAPNEGCLGQNAVVLRPHQSPAVTAVPHFVTYGDISPRSGENLSRSGEAFIWKMDFHVFCRRSLYFRPKRRYSFSMIFFRRTPWISASCTTFWYCARK